MLRGLDAHIRRRLRAIVLHHWKRRPTIVRNLIALGVNAAVSMARPSIRDAGPCGRSAMSHKSITRCGPGTSPTADSDSLVELHREWHEEIIAPTHEQLALEWG